MQHQGVAVGIVEEGHVTDARVQGVAVEAHTAAFERGAGGGHIVDVQRDRVARDVVLEAHLLRVDDAEGEVAGLELGEVAVGHVDGASEPECGPVELHGRLEVVCGDGHEVHAVHELLVSAHR